MGWLWLGIITMATLFLAKHTTASPASSMPIFPHGLTLLSEINLFDWGPAVHAFHGFFHFFSLSLSSKYAFINELSKSVQSLRHVFRLHVVFLTQSERERFFVIPCSPPRAFSVIVLHYGTEDTLPSQGKHVHLYSSIRTCNLHDRTSSARLCCRCS